MILGLVFAAAALIAPTQATYDDMDDGDFAAYLQFHDNLRVEHGQSAAKGCFAGAIPAAGSGFPALCFGCVAGAVTNVATDVVFGK